MVRVEGEKTSKAIYFNCEWIGFQRIQTHYNGRETQTIAFYLRIEIRIRFYCILKKKNQWICSIILHFHWCLCVFLVYYTWIGSELNKTNRKKTFFKFQIYINPLWCNSSTQLTTQVILCKADRYWSLSQFIYTKYVRFRKLKASKKQKTIPWG